MACLSSIRVKVRQGSLWLEFCQLCLVRYNNVPTPDLYMDCDFSSTFEISPTFPPINPGVPGVIVIFFFATLSPNCFSKLLIIVGCPNLAFCHHHSAQFEHLISLPNSLDFHLKMTLQYSNCIINGFLFANDQHIINVDYDDTNPFFIFFIQHAWVSFTELKLPPCILSTFSSKIVLLLEPIHKWPSAKLNRLLCQHLCLSLHHTLLESSYKSYVPDLHSKRHCTFPFKFSISILAITTLNVTSLTIGE